MARNQIVQLADFMRAQAFAVFEFYRFQPEFCYLFVRCDMNMRRLPRVVFIIVEEKSLLAFSQDCWHQTVPYRNDAPKASSSGRGGGSLAAARSQLTPLIAGEVIEAHNQMS